MILSFATAKTGHPFSSASPITHDKFESFLNYNKIYAPYFLTGAPVKSLK